MKAEDACVQLLSYFHRKLVDNHQPIELLRTAQLFPDKTLLREQRYGFFGWIDCDGLMISGSIDWLIRETEEDEYRSTGDIYRNLDKYYDKLGEVFANYDKYNLSDPARIEGYGSFPLSEVINKFKSSEYGQA